MMHHSTHVVELRNSHGWSASVSPSLITMPLNKPALLVSKAAWNRMIRIATERTCGKKNATR